MSSELSSGLALTLFGGIVAGNCMLPMKFARRWQWENTWLVFSLVSLAALPWALALALVRDITGVYAAIPLRQLAVPFLFGAGWGIAQVLFGLSLVRLGLALGYAIIIGLGAMLGTLVPLVARNREVIGTGSGALILSGIAVMILGIAISARAGRDRERTSAQGANRPGGNYPLALALAILCGLLAPMLNYSFAFGQDIAGEAIRIGTSPVRAVYAVWPVGLAGGLVANVAYSVFLLFRNRTWSLFRMSWGRETWLAVAMGVLWMGANAIYGVASVVLGTLGTSVGWALYQIFMIMTANVAGVVTGEWRKAPPGALRNLWVGLFLLAVATALIAAGNASDATPRNVSDLHAPGGGAIRMKVESDVRAKVESDYWRVEFDLTRGGVLDTVLFTHGSRRNLLVRPVRTYVDGWSDQEAGTVDVVSSQDRDVVRLEFRGTMGDAAGRKGPVSFSTLWTLTPFTVRAEHVLRLEAPLSIRTAGIGSTAVRPDLNEFAFRPGVATDSRRMHLAKSGTAGGAGTPLFSEGHTPLWILLFDRAVEGFDFTPASDYRPWEDCLGTGASRRRYEVRVAEDGASIEVLREPVYSPAPVAAPKGEHRFAYYLGLPRIVERSNRKWRHLSLGNHPFPSDHEIHRWAENGVNVVRYHNDFSEDGNFWRDGAWPPYDEGGMAELRRVIATCKREGIAIVPYFSVYEFHPEAEGFHPHAMEWMRMGEPVGAMIHNRVRADRDGEYGAQMCPNSGWLERRKRDIERAYRELGFDGIYYDWVKTLSCFNPKHGSAHHLSTDQVVDLLAWTRRLVGPQGILVLHLYGQTASIALENYADLVVNMEEVSSVERWMKITDVPIITRLAESIPRSPCPSYRPDQTLERNRNNISQLVVLGMFPAWRATGPSVAPPGGPGYELTLKLFRDFMPYRLESYRFYDALSGAVRTGSKDVYGAVYGSAQPPLVVISNTSPERRSNIAWRVDSSKLGFVSPPLVSLKDTSSGEVRTIPLSYLNDGSLKIDLDGWEYRIFEVREQRTTTGK